MVLRGGVRILLREGEALHTIQAERVTLNQTENLLTAEGDVEYTMTRGERTDRFSGDSLTFNTRSLEGVFFEGGTESDQQVDGETIRFRFLGDSITRLENSTVIMERARITSSKPVDPYYQIRARKVWILASGEWAVLGALLYVGRIPVLYLPFFFYPGEEFFFHPVIGTRDREGSFLQTTTYLLGQKKRSSTPLSILSLDAPQENQTLRRRRGLFLREVPGRTVDEEDLDRYLTVMADVYSRLGAFAGVKGSFPPEVSFSGGIGFSRSIFTGAGGAYTPYFEDPPGEYRTFWNGSRLLGLDLPFRYGIDSSWLLGGSRFSLSGRFEAYSDPFFPSDFFDRAEELDWSGLLGLQGGSGLEPTSTEKLNLTWELTAKADLSSLFSSPFFQTVSLQYLQARMLWQSFSRDVSADPLLAADPARRFYYPVSLQAPSVSLNLTGELLRVSSSGGGAGRREARPAAGAAAAGQAEAGYRAPAEAEEGAAVPEGPPASGAAEGAGEAGTPAEPSAPRLPGAREDLPLRAEREDFSFRLGYQIRPDLIVEQLFDPAGWTTPEAVDYDVLYTTLRLTDTAALNYELSGDPGAAGPHRQLHRDHHLARPLPGHGPGRPRLGEPGGGRPAPDAHRSFLRVQPEPAADARPAGLGAVPALVLPELDLPEPRAGGDGDHLREPAVPRDGPRMVDVHRAEQPPAGLARVPAGRRVPHADPDGRPAPLRPVLHRAPAVHDLAADHHGQHGAAGGG